MTDVEAPVAAAPAATTFGRRLAAERERLGLSVADIAARLRLHPKQVLAIENESLPALPAPFLRGFVRNYARELRLDPEPLIAELNQRLPPGDRQTGAPVADLPAPPHEQLSRRVVLVGGVGALVVFALIGWLASRGERSAAPPAPARVAEPPAIAAAPAAPQPEPTVATDASAAVPAATGEPTPSDGLRLRFREESWVEVAQGDGRVVFSQLNAPGTERQIEGKPPLRLVIGNASAVDVEYKGKRIDLKPATSSENVARVTLN
jgi:cytoskeleton protein RodZ